MKLLFLLSFLCMPLFCQEKTTININVDNQTQKPMSCDIKGIEKATARHYAVFIHCYYDDKEKKIKEKMISLSYLHDTMES